MDTQHRTPAWAKDDPPGMELAEVSLAPGSLTAVGVAIGTAPAAYRLDYRLEATDGLRTRRLEVEARGAGWRRRLLLERDAGDRWRIETAAEGHAALPLPGGDARVLGGAVDCDLGLSPLTNSMPVLRHGFLADGPADFVMAWVSVPDLAVHASPQRYAFVRALADGGRLVRFSSLDGPFTAEIVFDADGLVVDYPQIARRLA